MPIVETAPPAARRLAIRSSLIPIGLAVCFAAQCAWFIGTQSFTYDEPAHIIAGLDAWRHGRFELWNDQPPLGRLLVTAPLVIGRPDRWQLDDLGPAGANFWTVAIRPDPVALAWHTRPANVALGLVLMWLLWITARRLFSTAAASFALALFACSPALIAHFSLATVDGLAVVCLFATAAAVARWRRQPSWPTTCGLGLVLGAFLLSKYSAPPLVAVAVLIVLGSGPRREFPVRLAKAAAASAIALAAVWATYGFHVGPVTFRNGPLAGPYGRGHTVIVPLQRPLDLTLRLPAPEYIAALGGVAQHAVRGQPAFLLGAVRKAGGWPLYLPIVMALKWPPTLWLLAGSGLVALARSRSPRVREVAVMLLFPAVFFGLAMTSKLNIGDRYVLPVYPFLLLLAAAVWEAASIRPAGVIVMVTALALQGADTARYAPDYLSYMIPLVPPDRGYEWLSDSNLDWGQGLIALRKYERAHPDDVVHLAYFGGIDPGSYGVRSRPLGESERATGTVVVSATHLSGQYLTDPSAYRWLLQYPRKAILDHTLYVFDVPAQARP
jgi:hypothetical protein